MSGLTWGRYKVTPEKKFLGVNEDNKFNFLCSADHEQN